MDFLAHMMKARVGHIRGTREQLTILGRCNIDLLSKALDELRSTETVRVEESNGVVTLTNRRLKREEMARKTTKERVQKFRCNASDTPLVTHPPPSSIWNIDSGSSSTSSSRKGESEGAELVYAEYPRKVARKDAMRAIQKAIVTVGFPDLLAKTRAYATAVVGMDSQYIPHPATWFNRESYNDNPLEWNPKKTNGAADHTKPW